MRIVSWNCGGGLGTAEKIAYFHSLKADIAIIQEIRKSNFKDIRPDDFIWATNNHTTLSPKGLGILTFKGYKIKELDRDIDMELFLPAEISKNNFKFNLLGVWNFYSACKQGRFKGVNGLEFEALKYFKNIFSDPCLIAGDWNVGPTLTFARDEHFALVKILEENGLQSLYHEYSKEAQGSETIFTHNHTRGGLHLIDHIYGTSFFRKNMAKFEVHAFDQVVKSDHVPLILDVDISALSKVG